jgi:hypothetical protein
MEFMIQGINTGSSRFTPFLIKQNLAAGIYE